MLTLGPRPLSKFEHHDGLREHTLIAAARSQMTVSSPRGTFSQVELAGDVSVRLLSPGTRDLRRACSDSGRRFPASEVMAAEKGAPGGHGPLGKVTKPFWIGMQTLFRHVGIETGR